MRTYTTHQTITLATGTVQLDPAQASARKPCLREAEDDLYEVLAPIQFKPGERFGYDGDLPKAIAADVDLLEEDNDEGGGEEPSKPKPKPKPRAARKGKDG